jgi:beta-glucanase (GH16 family)
MALNLRLATLKLFGQFPKTEEYEKREYALREEYAEFLQFGESDEYKNYLALKEFVESGEPEKVKQELGQLKYNGSQEHKRELELKNLKKSKAIKNYLHVKNSDTPDFIASIENSDKPSRYQDLKQFVNSSEYKGQRKEHKKNNTEEYQKETEFNNLQKDAELKKYFKLKNWKPLKDYLALEGTDTVTQYYELEKYISSSEFAERKEYLLSKDKFKKTEAYQKLVEYQNLDKSEKIVWFHKTQNSKKFDEIKRWELSFADEFDGNSLNTEKWLPRYFWGEALIHKSYSLAGDQHAYTDGKNIELDSNTLKIITKREKAEGLSWDKRYGFVPKSFEYTSGIINTGQTFRQLYGKFEAKVKFTMAPNLFHAFWLVGDTMVPHIDVFRQNGNKKPSVQGSMYWMNGDKMRSFKAPLSGFNFTNNYYILGIEWTANKLTWKINGITYAESSSNIPDSPAYLVFSSGVKGGLANQSLPAQMQIEWVRCWRNLNQ